MYYVKRKMIGDNTFWYMQLGSGLSPQSYLYFQEFQSSKLLNGCLVVWQTNLRNIIICRIQDRYLWSVILKFSPEFCCIAGLTLKDPFISESCIEINRPLLAPRASATLVLGHLWCSSKIRHKSLYGTVNFNDTGFFSFFLFFIWMVYFWFFDFFKYAWQKILNFVFHFPFPCYKFSK